MRLLLDYSRVDQSIKKPGHIVDGNTPLHAAAYGGHTDAIRLLLDHQADIQDTALDGRTALHVAAEAGQIASMRALLDRKSDVNFVCKNPQQGSIGETPLRSAISSFAYKGSKPEKIEDTIAAIQLILSHPDLDLDQAKKEFHRLYYERRGCSDWAKQGLNAAYETMVSDSRFKELNSALEKASSTAFATFSSSAN